MKLNCQKEAFSIEEGTHYLNCAYMSPILKKVEEAGIRGILQKRNPQVLTAPSYFEVVDELRGNIAKLIHAKSPENIAITASASYGIANAAENVKVKKGQNIVLIKDAFQVIITNGRGCVKKKN